MLHAPLISTRFSTLFNTLNINYINGAGKSIKMLLSYVSQESCVSIAVSPVDWDSLSDLKLKNLRSSYLFIYLFINI